MKELFGQPCRQSNPYWIVKGYFDRGIMGQTTFK